MRRHEVWDKRELHFASCRQSKFLADFAQMPMQRHAVASHTVLNLAEEKRDALLPARTTRAAHARDAQRRIGQQTGLQQRNQRHDDARGVTARARDESRALDFVRTGLWQRVNGLREQFGRGMRVSVKLFIQRRAAQAEIGTQIDHFDAQLQQRLRVFDRHTVRQSQKRDLRACGLQSGRIRRGERERIRHSHAFETRKLLRERLSGQRARRDRDEFGIRMAQEQPQQLGS